MNRQVKTSELAGPALDWAVAKCEGYEVNLLAMEGHRFMRLHKYATNWAQGGPIIERERIPLSPINGIAWAARKGMKRGSQGATPLIAAMRCYVASKLGDEVEIPEELIA